MSSMASNYDMPKLYIGQAIAAVAATASTVVLVSLGTHRDGQILPFSLMTLSYGAMMYASSYVEEEQHFWYWSSSIWLVIQGVLHIRRYVIVEYKNCLLILTKILGETALPTSLGSSLHL
jgi:ethanolaminephosphotransferase